MFDSLAIVMPIFIVVGLGLAAGKYGLVSEKVGDGLSEFVYAIAIPALMFRTIAGARPVDVAPWLYWLSYFVGVVTVWALAMLLARRGFGLPKPESAIAGFSTGQANTVLIGIPLIIRAFGEAGTVPLFLLVAIHLPLTMSAATLLVERSLGGDAGLPVILWKLVTHPILIGIALGILCFETQTRPPEPVMAAINLFGDASAPCALFSMGMALSRYGFGADIRMLCGLAVLKLAVHPALVLAMGKYAFNLPPVWTGVAVLFAACPSGINAYLLAERYRRGVALSSSAISFTTLLSPLTTTFWVWLVTRL